MIEIYNSISKKREVFVPIKENHINIYVCGITTYSSCHLGHVRTNISTDIIYRYFIHLGYKVTLVRNITDIDDKIVQKIKDTKEDFRQFTNRKIKEMNEDFKALGIKHPTFTPRATDNIPEMQSMIQILVNKKYAYATPKGNVFYRIRKFPAYGKLSNQNLSKLYKNVRVEESLEKEFSGDFVLWKKSKDLEPSWDSPWGKGRPGWHIECSAMASKYLGNSFDIHCGGNDLKFPHHENEIAQSEAANNCKFANYWMHIGLLKINRRKMSKSSLNFLTIKSLLKTYHPAVLRFFIISTHYRSEINYKRVYLDRSEKLLSNIYRVIDDSSMTRKINLEFINPNDTYLMDFMRNMNKDFNTPGAIKVIFDLVKEIRKSCGEKKDKLTSLLQMLNILGVPIYSYERFLEFKKAYDVHILEKLLVERSLARKEENWLKADEIRETLLERGIELEDSSTKTSWKYIR